MATARDHAGRGRLVHRRPVGSRLRRWRSARSWTAAPWPSPAPSSNLDLEVPAGQWQPVDPDPAPALPGTAAVPRRRAPHRRARLGARHQARSQRRASPRPSRPGWWPATGPPASPTWSSSAACSPPRRTRPTSSTRPRGYPARLAAGPGARPALARAAAAAHRRRGAAGARLPRAAPGRRRPARRRRAAARPHAPGPHRRLHQDPPRLLPAGRAGRRRRRAAAAASGLPRSRWAPRGGGTPGTSSCPATAGAPWSGVVRLECSADLPLGRSDRAGRPDRPGAAAAGQHAAQGSPRAAEPGPDRRARARAAPQARRPAGCSTGACAPRADGGPVSG